MEEDDRKGKQEREIEERRFEKSMRIKNRKH